MASLQEVACCGIRELDGVQSTSAKDAVVDAANDYFGDTPRAFIFFSVIADYASRGSQLSAFIKRNHLGTVTRVGRAINGNTNNTLIMYVWQVNKVNFKRFWKEHGDYDPNSEDY